MAISDYKYIIKIVFIDGYLFFHRDMTVENPYNANRYLTPESTEKDIKYLKGCFDDEVKFEVVLFEDELKIYRELQESNE